MGPVLLSSGLLLTKSLGGNSGIVSSCSLIFSLRLDTQVFQSLVAFR